MYANTSAHNYSAGTPFYVASCHTCGVILNSGHHYKFVDEAVRECRSHDNECHGANNDLDADLI